MPGRLADVSSLSAELGLSESTLRRRCQDRIGIGPKTLQRILRFQGFLARVQYEIAHGRPANGAGLATLAIAAGYADQAHLSRECSRLTGTTPRSFLHEISEVCTGGHDHETSYAPLLVACRS
jgi:AraC-like DNA-binding protein